MNAIENEQVCHSAEGAFRHGGETLSSFPGLLRKIIENRCWERRQIRTGEVVEFGSLAELITAKPLAGWGWPEDVFGKIEAVIKDEPEVLEAYKEEMTGDHGGNRRSEEVKIKPNNVRLDSPTHGNSKAYTLSRLKKHHRELFDRVCAGELSANAAAIEAGFRKKQTPLDTLLRAWAKASETERAQFIESIQ